MKLITKVGNFRAHSKFFMTSDVKSLFSIVISFKMSSNRRRERKYREIKEENNGGILKYFKKNLNEYLEDSKQYFQ